MKFHHHGGKCAFTVVITQDLTRKISLSAKADRKTKFQGNKILCDAIRNFCKKTFEGNTLISSEKKTAILGFSICLLISLPLLKFLKISFDGTGSIQN